MKVTTTILCDFAQVRDGLLFIASGGVTIMRRSSFPAHAGVYLALMLELDSHEASRLHQHTIDVVDFDGKTIAKLDGVLQVERDAIGEEAVDVGLIPIVHDLRAVEIPAPGRYSARVYFGNQAHAEASFRALGPAPE